MGKIISKIFGNKEMRILMLGLDAAGKTSILYIATYYGLEEESAIITKFPGSIDKRRHVNCTSNFPQLISVAVLLESLLMSIIY